MAEQQEETFTTPKMAEIPIELITDILTYLPVKPLSRFKCVSKPWQTLISSPKFIKRHLNQTLIKNPDPNILLISKNSLISSPITDTKLQFTKLKHPLNNLNSVGLIKSYHGLILITEHSQNNNLLIFNPSINSHRFISPPPNPLAPKPQLPDVGLDALLFGFGYDGLNDDFKVVRLLQWVRTGDIEDDVDVDLYMETAVYSLRDDNWKLVNDETSEQLFLQQSHGVTANEMLHFVALTMDSKYVLKCFDLRTNKFLVVDMPELASSDLSSMSMSFKELRGCFCMLVDYHKPRVDPIFGVPVNEALSKEFLYADVWEMRERGRKESWVKLCRISQQEIVGCRVFLRLVTFSKDQRSLLLEVDGLWFGWYDLVSRTIKRVEVQGVQLEELHSPALTFVETLVSVNNSKVVAKGRAVPPRKNKKADFLSSGFKLKL